MLWFITRFYVILYIYVNQKYEKTIKQQHICRYITSILVNDLYWQT